MKFELPAEFDLSKHILVDEDGGCISPLLPRTVLLTEPVDPQSGRSLGPRPWSRAWDCSRN